MQQRDTEWHYARMGKATASRFKDILTQPQTKAARLAGEWSKTAQSYAAEIASEVATGELLPAIKAAALDHGNMYEEQAFELAKGEIFDSTGLVVQDPVGENAFWKHPDEPMIGCSPDGVIGDDGVLELKCPFNHSNHYLTVKRGGMPEKHDAQVQGTLWITGRKFYYYGSYCPYYKDCVFGIEPLFLCYVERDDDYINNELAPKVLSFVEYVRQDLAETAETFKRTQAWRLKK